MRFFMPQQKIFTAIQWTGNNGEEIQKLLGNNGWVKGDYVEIGCVHNGKPSLQNAHIGDWLFYDRPNWFVVKENELEQYTEYFPRSREEETCCVG